MKRSIRIFALAVAAIMAAGVLGACTSSNFDDVINALSSELNATEAPATDAPADTSAPEATDEVLYTEAPTDEPVITDGPSATDAPVITEAPAFVNDFEWLELEIGVPAEVDFDFDGLPDTVYVNEEPIDAFTSDYVIGISPSAHPENATERRISDAYWCMPYLVNLDPESKIMYLVASYDFDSDDTGSIILYADPESLDLCELETDLSIGLYMDEELVRDGKLIFTNRTEIMGTTYLSGEYHLTPEGPEFCGDYYYYDSTPLSLGGGPGAEYLIYEEDDGIRVIKKISVSLIDENGDRVETYKLRPDNRVWPIYTDGEHFVVCLIADGRKVQINFFIPDGDMIPHMDGYPQEIFFDVIYCD